MAPEEQQTATATYMNVEQLRAYIAGPNPDIQLVKKHVNYYETKLAEAKARRDGQSIDILTTAIQDFTRWPGFGLPDGSNVNRPIEDDGANTPSKAAEAEAETPEAQAVEPAGSNHRLEKALALLSAAGFENAKIAQATDAQLLAVDGIGPASLKQIRAWHNVTTTSLSGKGVAVVAPPKDN